MVESILFWQSGDSDEDNETKADAAGDEDSLLLRKARKRTKQNAALDDDDSSQNLSARDRLQGTHTRAHTV